MGRQPFPRSAPSEKYCPGCDETREAKRFWAATKSHDGLQAWCKYCASAYNAKLMAQRRRKPEAA